VSKPVKLKKLQVFIFENLRTSGFLEKTCANPDFDACWKGGNQQVRKSGYLL